MLNLNLNNMEKLKSVLSKLDGYKTYLVVLIGLFILVSNTLGWISDPEMNSLLVAVGLAGLAGLRDGIAKKK